MIRNGLRHRPAGDTDRWMGASVEDDSKPENCRNVEIAHYGRRSAAKGLYALLGVFWNARLVPEKDSIANLTRFFHNI